MGAPGYPYPYQQPQPPKKPTTTRTVMIVLGTIAAVGLVLVTLMMTEMTKDAMDEAAPTTSEAVAAPTPALAPPSTATATVPCQEAPSMIVDSINAAFTNGETLQNLAAVDLPDAMQYVGGDIFEGDRRVSSSDRWLVSNGVVYAVSLDARERTLLPDGTDMQPTGWEAYHAAFEDCVAAVR